MGRVPCLAFVVHLRHQVAREAVRQYLTHRIIPRMAAVAQGRSSATVAQAVRCRALLITQYSPQAAAALAGAVGIFQLVKLLLSRLLPQAAEGCSMAGIVLTPAQAALGLSVQAVAALLVRVQ